MEVCGQGRCGAVSLLADGQCSQPKLWTMGLSASGLCHGRISLLTQPGSDLAAGAATEGVCCSAVLCKNFLWAPLVSFHFHCNEVLQCAVTGTELLPWLMNTWKPGEAPWEGNVSNLDLIPLLEKKKQTCPFIFLCARTVMSGPCTEGPRRGQRTLHVLCLTPQCFCRDQYRMS